MKPLDLHPYEICLVDGERIPLIPGAMTFVASHADRGKTHFLRNAFINMTYNNPARYSDTQEQPPVNVFVDGDNSFCSTERHFKRIRRDYDEQETASSEYRLNGHDTLFWMGQCGDFYTLMARLETLVDERRIQVVMVDCIHTIVGERQNLLDEQPNLQRLETFCQINKIACLIATPVKPLSLRCDDGHGKGSKQWAFMRSRQWIYVEIDPATDSYYLAVFDNSKLMTRSLLEFDQCNVFYIPTNGDFTHAL